MPSCTNIADYLVDMARRQPHTLAVVFPDGVDRGGRVRYTHYTYAKLDAESDRLAAGLRREGIGRGSRVVLMTPPSLEFFALVFALFKVGAVLVAVDPGLGIKHLGRCLAEAEPQAFIGIPKAHWARKLFGWARGTIRKNIVVGSGVAAAFCGVRLEELRIEDRGSGIEGLQPARQSHFPQSSILDPRSSSSDLAAILFTSGSTGLPKGVVYTHAHFDAQLRALRDAFDIRPGEIDLATFPLFALYAPALGMTAIVPDMDFTRPGSVDPTKIATAIDDFGVTNLFGSPALLDRVSRWGVEAGRTFPTLRRVISAGAPVPARVIERMTKLLAPGIQVFTPYGATESIPVASIGSDEILGETARLTEQGRGVCVGRPVGDVVVRIIRIRDGAIERWSDDLVARPGEIGEIVVSGPAVTAKYHAREEATRLAKIADPTRPSGFWHRMGDLGYFDDAGRIWFCGRKSQRVRLATGELYTDPCEGVFNVHPDVRRSALVGIGENGRARPVICVELVESPRQTPEAIRAELLQLAASFEHTRAIRDVLFHPSFPVDVRHNAKIGREALARWAAGKLR
ncbi:MAG: peptide synthase [Planctomycetota bacterium]|nr:MAG: peptide synthase [Planctomycetota bacterium]